MNSNLQNRSSIYWTMKSNNFVEAFPVQLVVFEILQYLLSKSRQNLVIFKVWTQFLRPNICFISPKMNTVPNYHICRKSFINDSCNFKHSPKNFFFFNIPQLTGLGMSTDFSRNLASLDSI